MKIRNKKTGEIGNLKSFNNDKRVYVWIKKETDFDYIYDSLAELNEEWGDYEEPKGIWWLDNEGNVNHTTSEVDDNFEKNRQIGNYFETKEEAEKAVEKLKAWKRLKDKGVKITGWDTLCGGVCITTNLDILDVSTRESAILDLLFGGEE